MAEEKSSLVSQFAALKEQVASLDANRKFWLGKKEAHEANKRAILAQAEQMGFKVETLEDLKAVLEKRLSEELASLSSQVAAAEDQFNKLRSKEDVSNQT